MHKRADDSGLEKFLLHAVSGGLLAFGLPATGYRAWIGREGDFQVALAPEYDNDRTNRYLQAVMTALEAWLERYPNYDGEALTKPQLRALERVARKFLRQYDVPIRALIPKRAMLH